MGEFMGGVVIGLVAGVGIVLVMVGMAIEERRKKDAEFWSPQTLDELRRRDWYQSASPGLRERLEADLPDVPAAATRVTSPR